jgi:aryl-alcohol dehydrogenase-like predicted oxidoreductase
MEKILQKLWSSVLPVDVNSIDRELGVAVVAYSPLGRGLLTGAYTTKESISGEGDWRGMFPRFTGDNFDANVKLVSQFKELADKKGCTTAQLAIAWLMKQGEDIIPIPGTKKIKHLEENWGSLHVQLTGADEREMRNFVETAQIAGARTVDWSLPLCFTDTRDQ